MCCDRYKEFDKEIGGIVVGYGEREGTAVRILLRDKLDFDYCPYCRKKLREEK